MEHKPVLPLRGQHRLSSLWEKPESAGRSGLRKEAPLLERPTVHPQPLPAGSGSQFLQPHSPLGWAQCFSPSWWSLEKSAGCGDPKKRWSSCTVTHLLTMIVYTAAGFIGPILQMKKSSSEVTKQGFLHSSAPETFFFFFFLHRVTQSTRFKTHHVELALFLTPKTNLTHTPKSSVHALP